MHQKHWTDIIRRICRWLLASFHFYHHYETTCRARRGPNALTTGAMRRQEVLAERNRRDPSVLDLSSLSSSLTNPELLLRAQHDTQMRRSSLVPIKQRHDRLGVRPVSAVCVVKMMRRAED